jgi:hypothetical protein
MALVSLFSTWQTRSHLTSQEAARVQLALAVLTYLAQLGVGIALSASPNDQGLVRGVAYLLIVSFAIALIRAWTLLGTKPFAGKQDQEQQSQPAE